MSMKIIIAKLFAVLALLVSHFTPPVVSPLSPAALCRRAIASAPPNGYRPYRDTYADGGLITTESVIFSPVEFYSDGGAVMYWNDLAVNNSFPGSLDMTTCTLTVTTGQNLGDGTVFHADRTIVFHNDGGFDGFGSGFVRPLCGLDQMVTFNTGTF